MNRYQPNGACLIWSHRFDGSTIGLMVLWESAAFHVPLTRGLAFKRLVGRILYFDERLSRNTEHDPADAGVAVAERLTKLRYQEIVEGEELRAGSYEFWSGDDENGSEWSSVH